MALLYPDTSEQLDLSPIEDGVYDADIVKAEVGTAKSGNPKVVAHLSVEYKGKKRPRQSHMVIQGAGSGNFDQCLRACGFDALADDYKNAEVKTKPPFETDDLVGKRVRVIFETRMQDGKAQENIRGFLKV